MKKEAIEVIHVTSGQKIAVRTKSNRNNYFKLKNCLNEWFYTSGIQDKLRNFSAVRDKFVLYMDHVDGIEQK